MNSYPVNTYIWLIEFSLMPPCLYILRSHTPISRSLRPSTPSSWKLPPPSISLRYEDSSIQFFAADSEKRKVMLKHVHCKHCNMLFLLPEPFPRPSSFGGLGALSSSAFGGLGNPALSEFQPHEYCWLPYYCNCIEI